MLACGDNVGARRGGDGDAGGGADAAGSVDASGEENIDAGDVDVDGAPLPEGCDFAELDDAGNDAFGGGSAEASGVTFTAGGGAHAICGAIDPAYMFEGQISDADDFTFVVTGPADVPIPVRILMRAEEGATLADFGAFLNALIPDQDPIYLGGAFFHDGYGLLAMSLYPGAFRLTVLASDEPLPRAPVAYSIEIADAPPCALDADPADFTEADESAAGHRANDVIAISYTALPYYALTASPDDAPEATGLTLAADTVVHLAGNTAAVAPEDDYLDRDTFLITSGADVNEVDVRLTWPDGDVDIDALAFPAGAPDDALGYGALVGDTDDEVFTVRVPPGEDFWLWAGTYNVGATDLPVGYDLTLCPRVFVP